MFCPMNCTPDGRISVATPAGPVMVTKDHHAYAEIINAFHAGDVEAVLKHYNAKEAVQDYVSKSGKLFTRDNDIWVRVPSRVRDGMLVERRLNNDAARYLLELMREGIAVDNIAAVIERCYTAPTDEMSDAAFTFIFQNSFDTPLSLGSDGRVMGYKRVRDDFKDIFSGTVQYTPLEHKYPELKDDFAQLVTKPGEMVYEFESKLRTGDGCGGGLHVGNFEYVRGFHYGTGYVISLIFDPADVVGYSSVNYSEGKLRVRKAECGYIINDASLGLTHEAAEEEDPELSAEKLGEIYLHAEPTV